MKLFHQNLDTINRLLASIAQDPDRAMKAYSLGMISALAESQGVTAPDVLLEAAAQCETLAQAEELFRTCVEFREGAPFGSDTDTVRTDPQARRMGGE